MKKSEIEKFLKEAKGTSLPDLRLAQEGITNLIKEGQGAAEELTRKEILDVMKKRGITSGISELFGLKTKRGIAKSPVMYKNPATGETWTGKSRKPNWVVQVLATGGQDLLDTYKVTGKSEEDDEEREAA